MNRRGPKPVPPITPIAEHEQCACRPEIVRQSDGVIVQQQGICLLHAAFLPKQPRPRRHRGAPVSNAQKRRADFNRRSAA